MADIQPMIERERAASPGLAAITIRSDKRIVLFSTDRVTVGDEADWTEAATGWTYIGSHKVTVGLPVMNSFAERLGDVEVSALRSGLDVVHIQPLAILGIVASVFLVLSAALAWLGSAVLLHPVQRSVRAVTADASRAFAEIHLPRGPDSKPYPHTGEAQSGDAHRPVTDVLVRTTREVLGIIRDTSHDIARIDESEV
jgi:hypothetical protein